MGGVTVRDVDVSLAPSPFLCWIDLHPLDGLVDWMVISAEPGDSRDRGHSNLRMQYGVERVLGVGWLELDTHMHKRHITD